MNGSAKHTNLDREFRRYVQAYSEFEKRAPGLKDSPTMRSLVFNNLWERGHFDKSFLGPTLEIEPEVQIPKIGMPL